MKEKKDKNGAPLNIGDAVFFWTRDLRDVRAGGRQFGLVTGFSEFICNNGDVRWAAHVDYGNDWLMVNYERDIEFIASGDL